MRAFSRIDAARAARRAGMSRGWTVGLAALLAGCGTGPLTMPPAAPTPAPANQEGPLDRTTRPEAGEAPDLNMAEVQRRTLSNGLEVWVVEDHELPLVTLRLVVHGGSAAEPPEQAGLASMTASLLDEGTATRSALQIADEIDFLAANLSSSASYDASSLTLNVLRRNLAPALEIFADVLLNPSFPAEELDRVRQERLTGLISQRDQPSIVASDAFALRLYGAEHPYGRKLEGNPATLEAFTPDELRRFYSTWYRPNNGTMLVVGDVQTAEIVRMLEEALGNWRPQEIPQVLYPEPRPPLDATRVFLIDKPGAAQSEIRIGHVGITRRNPDYIPLMVLNEILGGSFSSRLNLNLREDKGYTYGARSDFSARRHTGPFLAFAAVQTPATKASIVEFMKELEEIRETRPVTPEELEFAKASLIRSEPLKLETQEQQLGRLQSLVVYDLPADYFDSYTEKIRAVTPEELQRVSRDYLRPDRFAVVIVGDRAQIEPALRELPYPVEVMEME